jgi:hypothetical protein
LRFSSCLGVHPRLDCTAATLRLSLQTLSKSTSIQLCPSPPPHTHTQWKVNTDAAIAQRLNPEPPPPQLTRPQRKVIDGVWHDVKLTPWQEAAHKAEEAERDRIAACRTAKKAMSVMVAQLWLYPKRSPLLVKHGLDGALLGFEHEFSLEDCTRIPVSGPSQMSTSGRRHYLR